MTKAGCTKNVNFMHMTRGAGQLVLVHGHMSYSENPSYLKKCI